MDLRIGLDSQLPTSSPQILGRHTPLYDYSQIMYRLSLDDPRLSLASVCVQRM